MVNSSRKSMYCYLQNWIMLQNAHIATIRILTFIWISVTSSFIIVRSKVHLGRPHFSATHSSTQVSVPNIYSGNNSMHHTKRSKIPVITQFTSRWKDETKRGKNQLGTLLRDVAKTSAYYCLCYTRLRYLGTNCYRNLQKQTNSLNFWLQSLAEIVLACEFKRCITLFHYTKTDSRWEITSVRK